MPREEDVDYYLKDFLKAKDFSVQHADKTDRAVAKLKAWLKATRKQATIGSVTAEVAADYLETVPGTERRGSTSPAFSHPISGTLRRPGRNWTRIHSKAWPVNLKAMPRSSKSVHTPMMRLRSLARQGMTSSQKRRSTCGHALDTI